MKSSPSALPASEVGEQAVRGPVDVWRPDGVLLRRLPGVISLSERTARLPESLSPTPELSECVTACLAGHPIGMRVLKTQPRNDAADGMSSMTGFEPAWIDVGFGPNANLVLTRVPGLWSWGERAAIFPGDGSEIRRRLARIDLEVPAGLCAEVQPSLRYATAEHPTSLQFEVTTRCNLGCSYCSNRLLPTTQDTQVEQVLEYFDAIDFHVVDNVDFTGLGEAALHKGLPILIAEVVRRGDPTSIRLVTNGTVIPRRVFEPLCEAGLTSVAFSIDSLNPETFARVRTGGRLSSVLRNLEALVSFRRMTGMDNLEIKIKAVLCSNPFHEAEQLLEYSARLGIAMPHFSTLDTRDEVQLVYQQDWLTSPLSAEQGSVFMAWCAQRWKELGGRPDMSPTSPSPAERRAGYSHPGLVDRELCRWAVDAAFVSGDGMALSCCEQMMDIPRHPFGSLTDRTMRALWNGDLLWSYRLPLSLNLVPTGCVGCAYAPARGRPLLPLQPASVAPPSRGLAVLPSATRPEMP